MAWFHSLSHLPHPAFALPAPAHGPAYPHSLGGLCQMMLQPGMPWAEKTAFPNLLKTPSLSTFLITLFKYFVKFLACVISIFTPLLFIRSFFLPLSFLFLLLLHISLPSFSSCSSLFLLLSSFYFFLLLGLFSPLSLLLPFPV